MPTTKVRKVAQRDPGERRAGKAGRAQKQQGDSDDPHGGREIDGELAEPVTRAAPGC